VATDGGSGGEEPAELADPVVSLRMANGSEVHPAASGCAGTPGGRGRPWRGTRSARGQARYPGYYWSSTTSSRVIYESRLELARLLIADFDLAVVAIAAQPFWLRARADGRVRRHVPDFFLLRADQSAVVINVKPAAQLADPEVTAALDWPGRLVRDHGWDYEIWTGADPVYLANLRFLAGYRRPWLVAAGLADAVLAAFRPGDTLAVLASRAGRGHPPAGARAAVLRLVWEQRLLTGLHRRLDGDSVLEAPGG